MAETVVKIDGVVLELTSETVWPQSLNGVLGGYSSLTLGRNLKSAPFFPDEYLGKIIEVLIDGDTYFKGQIVDSDISHPVSGSVVTYLCRDLRALGDGAPLTDDLTKTDSAVYNLKSDNPRYVPNRAGKTVGEIVQDILTMAENATWLDSQGIGQYTLMDPPTLPTTTIADLALLTIIPPQEVRISGGRLLTAISTWLTSVQPNHRLHVQADGLIRVHNLRDLTNHTLTLNSDLVNPPSIRRSVADCSQRVLIRGLPVTLAKMYTLKQGGIQEDFGYGTVSNADAKLAWSPEVYAQDVHARSEGNCSCTDTLTAVLTPSYGGEAWDADEWDQSHRQGFITFWSTSLVGQTQSVTRYIVSSTAKTVGGTCTVTLDQALPDLSYSKYTLYGASGGLSYTWRRYKVTDDTIWPALARQFSLPVNYVGYAGNSISKTSVPVGSVCWSFDHNPPYNEFPMPIYDINNDTGQILFVAPTYNVAGGVPDDVRVMLAVNTGVLEAVAPASGYAGTSHTVDGMERTWVVTMLDWRDPSNQANMDDYANELLNSVKDAVFEGSVTVNDLFKPALNFGIGVSITGSGFTTGLESGCYPVTSYSLNWNNQSPSLHTTTLNFSNRFNPLSESIFMKPERQPANTFIGTGASNEFFNPSSGTTQTGSPKTSG